MLVLAMLTACRLLTSLIVDDNCVVRFVAVATKTPRSTCRPAVAAQAFCSYWLAPAPAPIPAPAPAPAPASAGPAPVTVETGLCAHQSREGPALQPHARSTHFHWPSKLSLHKVTFWSPDDTYASSNCSTPTSSQHADTNKWGVGVPRTANMLPVTLQLTRHTGELNAGSFVGFQSAPACCFQMMTVPSCDIECMIRYRTQARSHTLDNRTPEQLAIVLHGMPDDGAHATSRTQSEWPTPSPPSAASCFHSQPPSTAAHLNTRTRLSHEPVAMRFTTWSPSVDPKWP